MTRSPGPRVLFVSNYFPPEVNAPANRLVEHARRWWADGHEVEVLTAIPNFPEGRVYEGYRNELTRESWEGIPVLRVPQLVAPNRGKVRRILAYLSFMVSAVLHAREVDKAPDVVVATSPQFFAGVAGWMISLLYRVPFVLEIRDLWPESLVAVGAFEPGLVTRSTLALERFLYRKADHIVVVTEAFRKVLVEQKDVPPEKVTVVTNGVEVDGIGADPAPAELDAFAAETRLKDRFVVSYIGTIGMAHRADILLDAALACEDPDIIFVVMGTGSERAALEGRARREAAPNFLLLPKQPREVAKRLLALSDAAVVHLRDSPLFRTVIPSKALEAMGAGRPVLLAVDGETRQIVEGARAGLYVPPEDATALAAGARYLKTHPDEAQAMGRAGRGLVREAFDRKILARRYWVVLDTVSRKDRHA